jgi:hypothetical protein
VGHTNSLPEIELRLQKGNHANPTACAPRRTEKNRPLLADLSSYHDGALSGGRVENPLSQTQRFRRRFRAATNFPSQQATIYGRMRGLSIMPRR